MRFHKALSLLAVVTAMTATGFAHHIAVVTNRENPVQNLHSAALSKILRGETRKWSNGTEIVLVLHRSSPDEAVTLQHLNKMTEHELKSFLASHKESIRLVDTDADVIDAVASTPGALGLVEARSINERITVVKVDGKLPLEGGYLPH